MNYSESMSKRQQRRKALNQRFRRMFLVALLMGLAMGFIFGRCSAVNGKAPDAPIEPDQLTIIQFSPCPTPGRGMPLGVEPSQQEMVALPSKIDQWIKCQARVHCAGHYMDDYYAFFPTVDEAKLMGHEIVRRFEAAGIRVNKRKCKVIPLTKPFRFCKARFTLTETGKIKVNGSRDGVKRARRKLKLFHREFKEGKRSFFDIEQYMECQSAYYRNFNDHGRLLRLRRLYHAIFFGGGQCLESSKPGPVSA